MSIKASDFFPNGIETISGKEFYEQLKQHDCLTRCQAYNVPRLKKVALESGIATGGIFGCGLVAIGMFAAFLAGINALRAYVGNDPFSYDIFKYAAIGVGSVGAISGMVSLVSLAILRSYYNEELDRKKVEDFFDQLRQNLEEEIRSMEERADGDSYCKLARYKTLLQQLPPPKAVTKPYPGHERY